MARKRSKAPQTDLCQPAPLKTLISALASSMWCDDVLVTELLLSRDKTCRQALSFVSLSSLRNQQYWQPVVTLLFWLFYPTSIMGTMTNTQQSPNFNRLC
jgi:hypothetical protein